MPGRCEGLSDIEWKLFEDIFPISSEKRGKGMPHTPFRYVQSYSSRIRSVNWGKKRKSTGSVV